MLAFPEFCTICTILIVRLKLFQNKKLKKAFKKILPGGPAGTSHGRRKIADPSNHEIMMENPGTCSASLSDEDAIPRDLSGSQAGALFPCLPKRQLVP